MAVVYATFSTWVTPTVQVEKGQMWDDSDPVVRSHPDWFTADPTAFVRHSGSYTAASAEQVGPEAAVTPPGEKRSIATDGKSFDEAASLRDDLEKAGVKVDKRWGLDKLREEYAKAAK